MSNMLIETDYRDLRNHIIDNYPLGFLNFYIDVGIAMHDLGKVKKEFDISTLVYILEPEDWLSDFEDGLSPEEAIKRRYDE